MSLKKFDCSSRISSASDDLPSLYDTYMRILEERRLHEDLLHHEDRRHQEDLLHHEESTTSVNSECKSPDVEDTKPILRIRNVTTLPSIIKVKQHSSIVYKFTTTEILSKESKLYTPGSNILKSLTDFNHDYSNVLYNDGVWTIGSETDPDFLIYLYNKVRGGALDYPGNAQQRQNLRDAFKKYGFHQFVAELDSEERTWSCNLI